MLKQELTGKANFTASMIDILDSVWERELRHWNLQPNGHCRKITVATVSQLTVHRKVICS